jgi:hypothetical protein
MEPVFLMPWTHRSFWIFPALIAFVLGLLALVFSRGRLREIYRERFQEPGQESLFLASVGFFTAVAIVRGLTLAIHYNLGPFHDISVRGRHIHHLVWGILLLLVSGYGWLVQSGSALWVARLLSMLYGVGSALTLDEFALWLNLRDVYWSREGRESFEALALFGALLSIGIFGRTLFQGLLKEASRITGLGR